MRLFYSYILFFLLCFPLVTFYVIKRDIASFAPVLPRFISCILVGTLLSALLFYVVVPTYREHIEPSITIISLMISEGYPAYTRFDDPNVYSILYGPTTYLFQSIFLQLFSDPILGSKVYGVVCFLIAMILLTAILVRKYNRQIAIQGITYFSITVLLFAQVSFRNQSDSIIILGNAMAVSSLLLPSTWVSKLMLASGSALAMSAKFHAAGYILPLLYLFYQKHGLKSLALIAISSVGLVFSPFMLDAYSLPNFLGIMQAYSKLKIHYWLFAHNLSMAYVIFMPLLMLMFHDLRKSTFRSLSGNESMWTFVLTNIMIVLVCLTAAIDGAGSYHIVHFAPVIAVLYAVYYARNTDDYASLLQFAGKYKKTILLSGAAAWFLAIVVFIGSVQKKYFWFIDENISFALHDEVLEIRDEIARHKWRAFMGYSGESGYTKTFYRPLLWPALKDNSYDPVALMGRQAVGVNIPDTLQERISSQYYDVIIIPKPGRPFSMYNWHDSTRNIFDSNIPVAFEKNYISAIEYKNFVLWKARGSTNTRNQ